MTVAGSFEICEGCPTITIVTSAGEKMFPLFSLIEGSFTTGKIELQFAGWIVEVIGDRLEKLWRHLQMQDVLIVRCSSSDADRCQVQKITLRENSPSEDQV